MKGALKRTNHIRAAERDLTRELVECEIIGNARSKDVADPLCTAPIGSRAPCAGWSYQSGDGLSRTRRDERLNFQRRFFRIDGFEDRSRCLEKRRFMAVGEHAGKVSRSEAGGLEGGRHFAFAQRQDPDLRSGIVAANEAAGLERRPDAHHAAAYALFGAPVDDALVGVVDEDDLEERTNVRRRSVW
ncbi:MAG TPA: hypothetical protein VLC06_13005 [Polyangia bacterium]|nr:hypothetical protein [Polyangia bacterium]